nr:pupal cuticle protein 36-like [Cherax quadricarinatus]
MDSSLSWWRWHGRVYKRHLTGRCQFHSELSHVNMILKVVLCAMVTVVGSAELPSALYGTPSRGSGGVGVPGSVGGVPGGVGGVPGGVGGVPGGVGGVPGGVGGLPGGGFGGSAVGGFGGSTGFESSSGGGHGGSASGGIGGSVGSAGGGFGGSVGGGFGGAGSGSSPSGSYSPSGPVVPILIDERQGPDQAGNYNFNFETGDGISRQEQGAPQGPTGAVAAQGGWSFTFPDGTPAVFKFVADEGGYRVESDLLPTPHPLPAHAIAQIEKARQEDAAAAAADGRGSYDASGSASQFTGAPSGGFGGSPAGGFGGSPAGGFGGSPAGGFGASPAGGFGASPAGGFGASPAGGFGASPAGGLGASPAGGFGASPAGGFGASPVVALVLHCWWLRFGASPSGGFGASPAGGFGASPAGGFGATPAGGFGATPAGVSEGSSGQELTAGASVVAPSRTYGAP